MSKAAWVNPTISEIIQLPQTTSAIATATAFGTKESVTSWICVTDWNREIAKPTTSEVTSTGAASFADTRSACSVRSMTACWSISAPPGSSR